MTDAEQLDDLARTVHDLVTETAAHQVSREIAHLAEISVDTADAQLEPPEGFQAPSTGAVTTHVVATSWDIPEASVETRVSVWISAPDAAERRLVVTRVGSDRQLEIGVDEVSPVATTQLRGRISDFVAVSIAHMVSSLNVAMQRTHIHED